MVVVKIIIAIVLAYMIVNYLLMSSRDKVIKKAKRDGKSWNEIYNEFYK